MGRKKQKIRKIKPVPDNQVETAEKKNIQIPDKQEAEELNKLLGQKSWPSSKTLEDIKNKLFGE